MVSNDGVSAFQGDDKQKRQSQLKDSDDGDDGCTSLSHANDRPPSKKDLTNTSSLTRRLATGQTTASCAALECNADSTSQPTTHPSNVSSSYDDENNNPFQQFSEYVNFFFAKAQENEEELEIQASQRDLTAQRERELTPVRSPSSPKLTHSMEAVAAVEAMCSFRSLAEVKREIHNQVSCTAVSQTLHDEQQQLQNTDSATGGADRDATRWIEHCRSTKMKPFTEIAIESLSLPISVDEFHSLFLQDGADYSFLTFMLSIGELDVSVSPWQASNSGFSRTIDYTHPVNAPMAPPRAKAKKTQHLHCFGNAGLCLETRTDVMDVPMTDCFEVDDRLMVSGDETGGGCTVSVTFKIEFVKTTMFRRIIENSTRGEFLKFWTSFANMVKTQPAVTEGENDDDFDLVDVAKELEKATSLLDEGQEVPLNGVLSRIRRQSRRLSSLARRDSQRAAATRQSGLFSSFVAEYRQQLADSDVVFASVCFLFLSLLLLNILNMWQTTLMRASLKTVTAQLQNLNEINAKLLDNLSSRDGVCQ
mmetsp:Transcript_16621/g.38069  ORF Transcript_16621/g.38069 Transcript_16621/m.38069 type:complete len:534 (-) Transcript_16621:82-1683(-)